MKAPPLLGQIPAGCLIPHLHVFHHVVVLRVVDTEGRTDDDSVLQRILCIEFTAVGVKGAQTVADIEVVGMFPVGDDIDGTAQGIATQPCRYHTLVDLDMVYQVHRQIGQRHARAFRVERHAVDEIAHGIARHTIDAQVEVGAYSALFTHLHTRRSVNDTVQ